MAIITQEKEKWAILEKSLQFTKKSLQFSEQDYINFESNPQRNHQREKKIKIDSKR